MTPFVKHYKVFHPAYEFLFNSYYNGVGEQFPQAKRGTLSRPSVSEIITYRHHIDTAMEALISGYLSDEMYFKIQLGLNHEQQHQELLCTDIKYTLGHNPLFPVYIDRPDAARTFDEPLPLTYTHVDQGVFEIGAKIGASPSDGFVFDNESPRHKVFVSAFKLANRLVTNGEYLAFIEDGGYKRFDLWLSDAWALLNSPGGFNRPLYWHHIDGDWAEYCLTGLVPLDLNKPVCHVSAYEADAFARWCNARLPTEAEWEVASFGLPLEGNLMRSENWQPMAVNKSILEGPAQMIGDVWEWTSSSYSAYPGFKAFPGQLGEYNGKFMANQLVLRGGSCVTPDSHIRATYRNFFYPQDRWQFSGIRLAKNL